MSEAAESQTTETTSKTEGAEQAKPEPVQDPEKVLADNRKKGAENQRLRAEMKARDAEIERLRAFEEAAKSDQQKAIDKAVRDARKEWDAEHRGTILSERLTAKAAAKLADPSDAVKLIDLSALDPDDGDGLDKALDDLLEEKPYLARGEGGGKSTNGKKTEVDQGPRGKSITGSTQGGEDPNRWLRDAING